MSGSVSLRFLNRILGTVESFRVAFPYAALRYRGLQWEVAFYISRGSLWDDKVALSSRALSDINWWLSCPFSLPARSLHPFTPDYILTTDSSESGWGATTSSGLDAYGFWSYEESGSHINVLESRAVFFGLKSLFRSTTDVSILIHSDNSSTVSYINNCGGRSPHIFEVMCDIFQFCIDHRIRLVASHLSGRLNTHADELSRRSRDHAYALPSSLFSFICDIIPFTPVVDLFASRLNHKLPAYYSAGPDPFAVHFDSLLWSWPDKVYAFPPIHFVDKFINRFLLLDITYGLLICPFWPSRPYFSTLLDLLIDDPLILSASALLHRDLLPSSLSEFLVCSISSNCVLRRDFQRRLLPVYSAQCTLRRYVATCGDGVCSQIGVIHGKLVLAHYL